jgi:cytochrome c-type biogenesis protein CcmF
MAALLRGEWDDAWAIASRPWVVFSWYFLALGLALGMLWAYVELGWGGYWAWDPVENAGLFPWLTATALVHTLAVQERRGMLRAWSPVLALLCFVLTIFGTFLTRSGFIASVHAFSRSNIGYAFLAFIALTCIFGAAVIIWRRDLMRSRHPLESPSGRETWFVISNWVMLFATALVIVLTLFPAISDWLGTKRAITPAAFNLWMAPLGLVLLAATALCPLLDWGRTSQGSLLARLRWPVLSALAALAVLYLVGLRRPLSLATWGLCAAVLVGVLQETLRRAGERARSAGASLGGALLWLLAQNQRRYGGHIVHIGMAMMFVGFAGEAFKQEHQVAMQRGARERVGRYTLRFDGLTQPEDAQKQMTTATLTVFIDGANVGTLQPAQWVFFRRPDMPTSEVGLLRGIKEDLFVALGNADLRRQAATFKVIINPLVNWIWLGFIALTLGTGLAEWPMRRRDSALAAARRRPIGER